MKDRTQSLPTRNGTIVGLIIQQALLMAAVLTPLVAQHRIVARVDERMVLCDELGDWLTTWP